jgi:hypothetical protein
MRQDWNNPSRVGENEAFWVTALAIAVSAGLGLLIVAAAQSDLEETVQRHATLTPDRRPILTPLSREAVSC